MRRTVLVMAPAMRADVNARVTGLAKTARIVSEGLNAGKCSMDRCLPVGVVRIHERSNLRLI